VREQFSDKKNKPPIGNGGMSVAQREGTDKRFFPKGKKTLKGPQTRGESITGIDIEGGAFREKSWVKGKILRQVEKKLQGRGVRFQARVCWLVGSWGW